MNEAQQKFRRVRQTIGEGRGIILKEKVFMLD